MRSPHDYKRCPSCVAIIGARETACEECIGRARARINILEHDMSPSPTARKLDLTVKPAELSVGPYSWTSPMIADLMNAEADAVREMRIDDANRYRMDRAELERLQLAEKDRRSRDERKTKDFGRIVMSMAVGDGSITAKENTIRLIQKNGEEMYVTPGTHAMFRDGIVTAVMRGATIMPKLGYEGWQRMLSAYSMAKDWTEIQ